MVFSWAWAGSMVIPTITAAHSAVHLPSISFPRLP
jgi:hypothetical protein